MFGKVAKGFFGSDRDSSTVGAEVEKLLARAADGLLASDKQEALAELSDLLNENEQAQKVVGVTGLPVLSGLLRDERDEKQTLRGALECLNSAMTYPQAAGKQHSSGAMNAELFAREEGNIGLVLGLLDGEADFYVRYHTLQLLTALAASGTSRFVEAVLAVPVGIVKLTDLLGDSSDVVRNEALLLLGGLARVSPEVRRIAAFEGAFERLLGILEQEGGTDGGIIVQDSLDMLHSLLANEQQVQVMFREAGHLQKLLALLKLPESHFSRSVPRQRAANIVQLLRLFAALLDQPTTSTNGQMPGASPQGTNAATLLQLGLLDKLLMLALKGNEPSNGPIRTEGLICLAHLITGFHAGQERLISSGLGWLQGTPALRQVLRVCLHGTQPPEQAAAKAVIAAFCLGNLAGQSMLAATLVPAAGASPASFGGELLQAMADPNLATRSRAAAVLTCMVEGNAPAKQRLLGASLPASQPLPGTSSRLMMPNCLACISEAVKTPGKGSQTAAAILLRLLVTWLADCPAAISRLLEDPAGLPLLTRILLRRETQSSNVTAGLAALLLGVCLSAEKDRSPSPVLDLITTEIGLAAYFARLDGLFGDETFKATAAGGKLVRPGRSAQPAVPSPNDDGDIRVRSEGAEGQFTLDSPFDRAFVRWATAFEPIIRSQIVGGASINVGPTTDASSRMPELEGLPTDQQLVEAQKIIHGLERDLESLRSRNRALTQQAIDMPARPDGVAVSLPRNPQADAALRAAEERASAAQTSARSSQQETEALKGRLRQAEERCSRLEAELGSANEAAADARSASAKHAADLEALGTAYTSLESHAHSLQTQLDAAGGRSSSPKAAEPGEEEPDDQLNDLLACLGEEEQKVEHLKTRLRQLGEDPDALLEALGTDDRD